MRARLAAGQPHDGRSLPDYLAVNAELEAAQVPMPIVFGHTTFCLANFLDDGKRLWLIPS
jgi:hypothetical protein